MFPWLSERTGITSGKLKAATAVLAFIAAIWPAWTSMKAVAGGLRDHIDGVIDQRIDAKVQPLVKDAHDIKLDLAHGKLEQAQNSLAEWKLKLQSATDQTAQQLINDRIQYLNGTISKLQRQIKTLEPDGM